MKRNENNEKAALAMKALAAYSQATGSGMGSEEEIGLAVQDLLSDLMHLCGRSGFDFRSTLARAERHFEEEVNEAEEVSCAFCGRIVAFQESYSPGEDALCGECNKDVRRGGR